MSFTCMRARPDAWHRSLPLESTLQHHPVNSVTVLYLLLESRTNTYPSQHYLNSANKIRYFQCDRPIDWLPIKSFCCYFELRPVSSSVVVEPSGSSYFWLVLPSPSGVSTSFLTPSLDILSPQQLHWKTMPKWVKQASQKAFSDTHTGSCLPCFNDTAQKCVRLLYVFWGYRRVKTLH